MYFSGLMVSKTNFQCGRQDCLPGGEVMNLLVNFFEGCNEGIIGKETKGRGSTVQLGNNVRGEWCVCVRGERRGSM